SLIDKNRRRIKKDLIPMCQSTQNVRYHHSPSTDKEAVWIAEEIERLHEGGTDYKDITILYRAHYVTRAIEDVFLKKEIPYTIYSGVQFFGRAEIKDALSYLRMIAMKDDLSFLRIVNLPRRNMGDRRIAWLQNVSAQNGISLYEALKQNLDDPVFANTKAKKFVNLIEEFSRSVQDKPVSVLLGEILDESGYEMMLRTEGSQTRLDNLAELKQSIHEYEVSCGEETDLSSYLNHIALFTNQDVSEKKDQVRMMTIHTAKGLEFPYVFLCGMNEGILPSRKTNTETQMEEERRLAFVAMTRAEKGLYLSDAEGMNFDRSSRYVSRFILDIDKDLLEYDNELKADLLKESRSYIERSEKNVLPDEQELPFKAGDRVIHRVFGEGTVEKIDYGEEAVFVKFDSMATSRGISLRAASKLKKVFLS
ncbi:MAG: ATP-binding domain-containing protein, partial [Solobacterium sp.]|nr:ATP-binding domain-containing protein [Solobacterium sp.]